FDHAHCRFRSINWDAEVNRDLLDDCRVEPLANERPQEHGPGQSLLHSLQGADDEPVGLWVWQQAMALLRQGRAQIHKVLGRAAAQKTKTRAKLSSSHSTLSLRAVVCLTLFTLEPFVVLRLLLGLFASSLDAGIIFLLGARPRHALKRRQHVLRHLHSEWHLE